MKRLRSPIALLTVALLGMGGTAVAVAQDVGDGAQARDRTEQRPGRNRSDDVGNRRSGDGLRREARQQRRDAEVSRRDFGRDGGNRRSFDNDPPRHNSRVENRFDRRMDNQHGRTRDGWRDGELTRKKMNGWRNDQHRNGRMTHRFGQDGRTTHRERHKPDRALDRSSRRALGANHNGWQQRRDWGSGHANRGRFDHKLDRRQANQRARIADGWENGDLTRRELGRLRKDQREIRRMERRFGEDGRYTKRERRQLTRALDRSSSRIRRAKTNDRYPQMTRNGRWGR